jgi:signal transduction histidine kinase
MSAATKAEAPAKAGGTSSESRPSEPGVLTVLELSTATAVLALIALLISINWSEFLDQIPQVVPWIVVVALADLLPVPVWESVELMTSFPILLAVAFVFPPYVAGFVSFVGASDRREIHHDIPAGRALYNRSNVALSVMAASWVFGRMNGNLLHWPDALFVAAVALAVDVLINGSLLVLGTKLLTGLPPTDIIRNVYGGKHSLAFAVGYACFGLLALVLATVYIAAGTWGLLAFAVPVFLARQMFQHWKELAVSERQLGASRRALTQLTSRIVDERRDERLAVAAGIHDEVLPPMYKAHLMGQVLRQDFASGRLLDLEADIPDLIEATEAASVALRDLIGDLRRSTLGPGGLVHTLELLTQTLAADSGVKIRLEAGQVPGTPLTHLLLYQVAREALANVVKHSEARNARVILEDCGDAVRLVVEDDGRGFSPSPVDDTQHFGLQLMRERVELVGGVFFLEASSQTGTRVIAKVPVDRQP